MSFLYPGFLYTLFAVSIPIIIHLFNFRSYKTVYFSNVKFLKDVQQETRSKSTLKHLLVLISRISAIAALVFAFAQPYIPTGTNNTGGNTHKVCIYIDNSFSTQADSKYGNIFEVIKKKALETAEIYPENTKFLLLTNDFEQKHLRYVSKEQLKDFILETEISPSVRNISSVISKSADFFKENEDEKSTYTTYVISDFQKSSSDFKNIQKDTFFNKVLLPVKTENINNMYIDSVWFEEPERPLFQSDELKVKITNRSDESYTDIPLNLYLNDTLKAAGSFTVEANKSITETINFINDKTGIVNGRVELSDFPVTYDNEFLFNFNINEKIPVLIISGKNKNEYIENVFKSTDYVQIYYKTETSLNYEDLSEYNVIILDETNYIPDGLTDALVNYTSEGGRLLIFPGIKTNIESHNKLYNKLGINLITGIDTSKIYAGKINYNASVFKNVFKIKEKNPDLPYFLKRVKFSDQTYSEEEIILLSERNDKLISSSTFGSGKIYIFSQAPDDNAGNLVFHPIWAPMIYNMIVFGASDSKIYYIIGKNELIKVKKLKDKNDLVCHIINKEKNIDLIPRSYETSGSFLNILVDNMIKEAGHYALVFNNMKIKGLTFNYDRTESDLSRYSTEEIESILKENNYSDIKLISSNNEFLSETLKDQNLGKQLANLFLIAALFFLLAEILLTRFLK